MDPDKTLELIEEALNILDYKEAEEKASLLAKWIEKKGFEPNWDNFPQGKKFYIWLFNLDRPFGINQKRYGAGKNL